MPRRALPASRHHTTGVEMEALTGASVAALTIYDMCKALSHDIEIASVRLLPRPAASATVSARRAERGAAPARACRRSTAWCWPAAAARRMQRDKAALELSTGSRSSSAPWSCSRRWCAQAFVSVRADQRADPLRARYRADRRSAMPTSARSPASSRRWHAHPGGRLAGAGLRPAVPRSRHARSTCSRARDPRRARHRLSHQPRRPARTAVRDLRAAQPRGRSTRVLAPGSDCPRKFLIDADDARCSIEPNPRRSTTSTRPRSMRCRAATCCARGRSAVSRQRRS